MQNGLSFKKLVLKAYTKFSPKVRKMSAMKLFNKNEGKKSEGHSCQISTKR